MSVNEESTNVPNQLAELRNMRKYLKSNVTRFQTFLNKYTDNQFIQLKKRVSDLEVTLQKFNDCQFQIELLDNTLENQNAEITLEFENKYYEVLQQALEIIQKAETEKENTMLHINPSQSLPNLVQNQTQACEYQSSKFPTIELIKFYGEYDKWPQFRDLYKSLIHDDPKIQNVRKFYYLLGSLKGPAEKILSGMPVTNENYDIAWNILCDRFENETLTIKNHVKELFNLPSVSETYSLRNLKDDFEFRYRAIEALKEPVKSWDTLLIHLLTSKFDENTEERWDELLINRKIKKPTLDHLLEFLADRCSLVETKTKTNKSVEHSKPSSSGYTVKSHQKVHNKFKNFKQVKSQNFISIELSCIVCKNSHQIFRCNTFKEMSVNDRWNAVKNLKVCTNCLRTNHLVNECVSQGCKVCSKKHNTLLHIDNENNIKESETQVLTCIDNPRTSQILLSTAVVYIQDFEQKMHRCRVLLDSGAQSNFITENLCNKLKLKPTCISLPVVGVGGNSNHISKKIKTTISSLDQSYTSNLSFLVINQITSQLPTISFSKHSIPLQSLPTSAILADPDFNKTSNIDLLIGAQLFYSLLIPEQINMGDQLPILQNSHLGWIISGPLQIDMSHNITSCNISVNSLHQNLEKFWEIEHINPTKSLTPEELKCEKLFQEGLERDANGHFIVSLPVKDPNLKFGNSLNSAIQRLLAMERKFHKQPEFKQRYVSFMREYAELGHMEKITSEQSNKVTGVFYLPHHGILKESSTTTKLRVVFDGSCKTDNGISLNDNLLVGPTIQEDLFSILTRFRQHTYVLTADLEKMYRQVYINPHQRNLQRIVWRENFQDPIQHYTLNTVTYGTASASFLAIRSLMQIGLDHETSNPQAAQIIQRDFYVDDLISGASSINEARKLQEELCLIFSKYGFNLRKWVANDIKILPDQAHSTESEYHITDDSMKKALGVCWFSQSDEFKFIINPADFKLNKVTKRNLLSSISKIFDPLGLIAPVTIRAKILIQSLWQIKCDWDHDLPQNISDFWDEYSRQLNDINLISIPRHVIDPSSNSIELHIFSDASLRAYGASVYVKSYFNNQSKVSLLCAKTKVAPIKTITLPRLELCGALLGVKLYLKVMKSLTIVIKKSYFWTDSSIVLSWLRLPANSLKIFVSNRISIIQEHTSVDQWFHVPSADNPADILSRGTQPSHLKNNQLWWNGPPWLTKSNDSWPSLPFLEADLPEKRNLSVSLASTNNLNELFNRYSSFIKLQRVTACILRFINNCRSSRLTRKAGMLSVEELNSATLLLVKLSQEDSFSSELNAIRNNRQISKKSKLLSLSPILGHDKLLRVGGRLSKSNLPYNQKHQIILSSRHPLTTLIILNEHKRQLHAGIQTLLVSLRQSYWIPRGRQSIRSILRKCIICFKSNPSNIIQKMAELPTNRVEQNRPFYISGVDFAGPFYIKDGKLRNRKIIKAYLCVFICFSTKAVHFDLAVDLSTQSFLNVLKRFISRRGICKLLYSDNGTNFVGTNNELKSINDFLSSQPFDHAIMEFLSQNFITWKFIPSRSPHHGGLWEAAVKRAKYHLLRILKNSSSTFEELYTVICQAEAIVNSRPLTPISDDPDDLYALTPGHFLIGEPLTSLPHPDLTSLPTNRLDQYQVIQQSTQQFWKRWSNEYLATLQPRSKWHDANAIHIGSLVLIMEENLPPLLWKMGRIISCFKGSDGLTRTCTVKTSNGVIDRAVQKLCLLPMDLKPNSSKAPGMLGITAKDGNPASATTEQLTAQRGLEPESTDFGDE